MLRGVTYLSTDNNRSGFTGFVPIAFEDVGVLAALAHPDHLLFVGSRGFARLPPTHISKSNGYKSPQSRKSNRIQELNSLLIFKGANFKGYCQKMQNSYS
ncbi:hypothetical protein ACH42_09655 [Endozoicomonas sp. (ex Bugula neritina AB1)]|nr:hypothetical protein ACH42_09655 [Endozoicomonas sp. (ex Bugula neritina AB1)]